MREESLVRENIRTLLKKEGLVRENIRVSVSRSAALSSVGREASSSTKNDGSRKKMKFGALVGVLLAVVGVTAMASGVAFAQQKKDVIITSYQSNPGTPFAFFTSIPIYMKYYEAEGLNVTFEGAPGGANAVQRMITDSADLIYLGTYPIVVSRAKDVPLKSFLHIVRSSIGYAAGLILSLSCDLRVVSSNASFCASGARVGLLPIGGQLSRLMHLMSYGKALEMLLTADPISAEEADRAGFVNQLVTPGEALSTAQGLAEKIAANSPAIIQEVKQGFAVTRRQGPDAGEMFEWTMGQLLAKTPDTEEGVRAFLEKRPPKFADK